MKHLLSLLKSQLVIDESSQDDLLNHYLMAAISSVEKYSGVAIVQQELQETFLVVQDFGLLTIPDFQPWKMVSQQQKKLALILW